MRVLHICQDYPNNALYSHLLNSIESSKQVKQTIYAPRVKATRFNLSMVRKSIATMHKSIEVVVSEDYSRSMRYIQPLKKSRIVNSISEKLNIADYDLIHAHSMFIAGGVASTLSQRYGVPFINAVRNTDLNVHLGKYPFSHKIAKDIFRSSSATIFLSPSYRDRFLSSVCKDNIETSLKSAFVIPNGIHYSWFDSKKLETSCKSTDALRILFIGKIDQNKNLRGLLLACHKLVENGSTVSIDVLGDGPQKVDCQKLSRSLNLTTTFHGYQTDRKLLQRFMQESHVLAVPSFHETFGLVYAEAMSQGLPVIYSRGEGIDGYFKDGEVGYAIDPRDPETIATALKGVQKNFRGMSEACQLSSKRFQWNDIASEYLALYKKISK